MQQAGKDFIRKPKEATGSFCSVLPGTEKGNDYGCGERKELE